MITCSKFLHNLLSKNQLSENNAGCSCSHCGDFANGFSRRVEYLWRFLDSTSMAYKGRENEAQAWLKKHHESKWEMKEEEKDGCVCLWWKGQPVSFCSLWKTNLNASDV
nr:Transcription factor GRAS [Ipomoea trifida]